MYAVSDDYAGIYRANHDFVAIAEVWAPDGSVLASSEQDAAPLWLPISAGTVEADATAMIRRTVSLSLADPLGQLVPAEARDLFSVVSDNEIAVFAGLQSPLGITELFPQGVFVLTDSDATADAQGVRIEIKGQDRALRIQERSFVRPYTVPNYVNYIDAIQALIWSRASDIEFDVRITTSHQTTWQTYDEQSNPLDAVTKMAESIGAVVYFDVDGFCVIDDVPDPALDDPDWEYIEGTDATFVSVGPKVSRANVRNGAIVVGESVYGITPARAEVWDTDPASPTYVGTYGRVPEFTSDPRVRTKAQALASARGRFLRRRGMSRQVEFSVVPNPAQQEDDVVYIGHDATHLDDTFVIQRLRLPLTATGPETITTRERQVTA